MISYVCMSDVHFGAANSLLTFVGPEGAVDTTRPSPVAEALAACLRALLDGQKTPPTLILNGDILDLALSDTQDAFQAFERFVERTLPLFQPEVIYLAGNHDHHVWEEARSYAHVREVLEALGEGRVVARRHTTGLRSGAMDIPHVTALMQRSVPASRARGYYPSYAVASTDGRRLALFHHGHFLEDMYFLQSTIMDVLVPGRAMPVHVEALEADNGAWIDYFWSTLGRSGEVGREVGVLYDVIQSPTGTNKLIDRIAARIAALNPAHWLRSIESAVLNRVLQAVLGRMAGLGRNDGTGVAPAGLAHFVEIPLRNQIRAEFADDGPVSQQCAFVFGHTHKPFEAARRFNGYAQDVHVYNSGGWVVDTLEPNASEGGAVILLDENLNAASLRMYNEGSYGVRVETVGGDALADAVRRQIAAAEKPWQDFSNCAAAEVTVRALMAQKLANN